MLTLELPGTGQDHDPPTIAWLEPGVGSWLPTSTPAIDPPARLTLPNVEGLGPRDVTEMYSFDHDLGHFVSIGPATVSRDGATIVANAGVGVIKAGWHCGGNPPEAGTPHCCDLAALQRQHLRGRRQSQLHWMAPHEEHRNGLTADVRIKEEIPSRYWPLFITMAGKYRAQAAVHSRYKPKNRHFHIRFAPATVPSH